MKKFFLTFLFCLPLAAQDQPQPQLGQPLINTYYFTKADCSPLSMLMLFRPPGFVCTPSANVGITTVQGDDTSGFDLTVYYQKLGSQELLHTQGYVQITNNVGNFHIDGENFRIIYVIAIPQKATSPVIVRSF